MQQQPSLLSHARPCVCPELPVPVPDWELALEAGIREKAASVHTQHLFLLAKTADMCVSPPTVARVTRVCASPQPHPIRLRPTRQI